MFYTASTWRRIFAYMIDAVIIYLCWSPLWIQNLYSLLATGTVTLPIKWIIACFVFQFLYRVSFLYFLGGTIGKLLFGLKVVSQPQLKLHDENVDCSLSWMQSFLRVFADHLSFFLSLGTKSLLFLRLDRTHVSDWVAETQVVQRDPREFPPHRRLFLALFLCLYFSATGLMSAYKIIKKSHFEGPNVTFEMGDWRPEN